MLKRRVDVLVLGSKETVTVEGSGSEDIGVIEDGGVAVRDGKIIQAASSQLLERKYEARSVIDAEEEVILPGLVDPHTHMIFDGTREDEFQQRLAGLPYMEILKRGGGILETVRKTRLTTETALISLGLQRLDRFLEAGTTTIEVKSGYGLRTIEELKILRATRALSINHPCRVVPTFLGAHAVPTGQSSTEYSGEVIEEMLPRVVRERLATFCDVFCEEGAFNAKESARILKAGIGLGLKGKIHADEFTWSGGARVAAETGCTSADHLIHSQAKDQERMLRAKVSPVLLPASSHTLLSSENAMAREMLSMGLPVALGTDFSPANWVVGQLTVAALAARELRMRAGEIIQGITINAARAIGMEDIIGSLAEGKKADLVTLKVPNHKWIGYGYGEGVIDKVLIGGQLRVDNGKRLQ